MARSRVNRAVVVGALGVIGRNLVNYLEDDPDWEVIGLSRRSPDCETRAPFMSVGLVARADAGDHLATLGDVTHVSSRAFAARPTWAEHNQPNLAMLVNAGEPSAAASPALRHVNLIEGNKIYGSHLG